MILSNRQYPMLKALYDNGTDAYMNVDDAAHFDQRSFGSMLFHGWCAYRPGRGFHITRDGKRAMLDFLTTDILRKNFNRPLTSRFDPVAYGLAPRKQKVVPMRQGAA